ncbi:MAG: hypothetical protein GF328_04015 [Candidatus Latescibacteria bacterium]|nr:hypothetical protein [Candidatus Latescibacterota bacterium]
MKILIGLSALLLLSGLAACGGGEEGDDEVASGPEVRLPAVQPEEQEASPGDGSPEQPEQPKEPAVSRAEALASEFVESLQVEKQYSKFTEEILAGIKEQYPEMTEEEASIVRKHVLEALEKDFEQKLVDSMVEYFTVEDLEAMKNRKMNPELEKKLPGWQEFSRERGREWGERVGKEAAEKALEKSENDR